MRRFRLTLTVVGLTVLIWMAADQSLMESADLTVTIEPISSQGDDYLVELVDAKSRQVHLTVVGQRKLVADVARTGPHEIRIPVEITDLGHHKLDLAKALSKVRGPLDGLTIETTEPTDLWVNVDRIITKTVPVETDRGALEFEESSVVEPPSVKITIREEHWKGIEGKSPTFRIPLDRILRGRREGDIEEAVTLETVLLGVPVQPDPARVVIRGKLVRPLVTQEFPAVPIHFSASPAIWNQVEIELPQDVVLTQTLKVRGPREAVERLQSGEHRLVGTIVITGSDAEAAGTFRTVQPIFRLPPDVELVDPPAAVEFRLKVRSQK